MSTSAARQHALSKPKVVPPGKARPKGQWDPEDSAHRRADAGSGRFLSSDQYVDPKGARHVAPAPGPGPSRAPVDGPYQQAPLPLLHQSIFPEVKAPPPPPEFITNQKVDPDISKHFRSSASAQMLDALISNIRDEKKSSKKSSSSSSSSSNDIPGAAASTATMSKTVRANLGASASSASLPPVGPLTPSAGGSGASGKTGKFALASPTAVSLSQQFSAAAGAFSFSLPLHHPRFTCRINQYLAFHCMPECPTFSIRSSWSAATLLSPSASLALPRALCILMRPC
jgi:hypothetical protein